MQSIMLPISTPFAKGYLHHAYQLAILGVNKDTNTWIFMNYIQLVSLNGNHDEPVTFYLPDYTGYNWNILTPWFDYSVITRDFLINNNIDFNNLIISALLNGEYLYLYVNERYITGTEAQAKEYDFNHQILIYGYDGENERYSVLVYDETGHFTSRSVHVDKMSQAYYNNSYNYAKFENRLYTLKLREDEGFKLEMDISYIAEMLRCLRDSKQVINNVLDYHIDYKYTYGLNTYDNLIVILEMFYEELLDDEHRRLIIPLHILMEHKLLMVERLKFISVKFPALDLRDSIQDYIVLQKSFEALRNFILMYKINSCKNKKLLTKAIGMINEVKERERSILTKLISRLS